MSTIPLEKTGYRTSNLASTQVDAAALAAELRARIRGEVRFDAGSRALYATDGSNYRQVPIGVVIPRTIDDVVETMAAARRYDAPILARGCGTSLAGQCCNVAVVIDCAKYLHGILEIDAERRRARVQPGTILDDLRQAAERYHLTFGPDPATHNHCTLGGMIGNNSCGVHSVMAGRTADNVEALEVLTYDGLRLRVGRTSDEELEQIVRAGGRRGEIYAQLKALRDRYAGLIRAGYPKIPRRVSGYNLDELLPENGFHVARALVGSESTCVTVLEATLRLVHSPPARSLLVLGYPDVYAAGDHIPEIMEAGPVGCEGLDDRLIGYLHKKGMRSAEVAMLPPGNGWLLVEFGGEDKQDSDAQARRLMERLKRQSHPPSMKLFDDPTEEHKLWEVRESGLGATANVPGMRDTWPGWEDSAVPPDKLGGYLRDLRRLFEKHGYECSLYGHFGQACVHVRIDFDLETRAGIDNYLSFIYEAADLVVSYGGSLSGEHGDGQARAALLPKMYGPELMQAFREFKAIWDPAWKMNPGKVVEAYGPDQNLRLGTGYHPWNPPTHFRFPDDHGSFARSALRCVGVGKCRRTDGGTMCPSFMVTREEEHSTRGRARLLFEMLQQDVIGRHGWRDDHVKEALDLCLACKGCKGDCPVNVDMATYKSEFLSHYYEGRWRPRSAYAFGLIFYWARAAALMPNVVNFLAQAPGLSTLAKAMAGMAQERQIPRFAPQTFRDWFRRHPPQNVDGPPVILWPDTFNNYFHPETAQAAVRVLEAAGYRVLIPRPWLCCGRPLYDYGMLDRAKGLLRRIMTELRTPIADGLPIVILEPSCAAVFRDELVNLFPHDQDAKRLHQQTFLLSEFLEQKAQGLQPPKMARKAVVHGHCHHKAVMGMASEEALLSKLGLDFDVLDSGCCGMAGSFGFEAGGRYDISVKAGERVLLPAVRGASKDTLIIADGFSCREQIAQMTDRRALHLAQVIDMALHQQRLTPAHQDAEAAYLEQTDRAPSRPALTTAACVGVGSILAGGLLAWALQQRRAV
jgi:FAD/FMN-containing dehydrogenase/Fe-S oxidoreductase